MSTLFRSSNLIGLLQRSVRLENAAANRVDVLQDVEQRYGLLGLKRRTIQERVASIGFRNWGQEVSGKDLREVRRATGLTVEQGYDSDVFFQGLDPLESLMAGYYGPLRRLARK